MSAGRGKVSVRGSLLLMRITPGTGRETVEIFLSLTVYGSKIGLYPLEIYCFVVVARFFDRGGGEHKPCVSWPNVAGERVGGERERLC
jgi:hypothetical protein